VEDRVTSEVLDALRVPGAQRSSRPPQPLRAPLAPRTARAPRTHATRSRANPGGIVDVLEILGPDVQPHRVRKPPWFKVPAPGGAKYRELKALIDGENLHTVCQEAACPNIGECWQRGTATFMILGDTCTRRCGFCNVKTGKPTWNDPLEPARVARSVARMGLRHAVITSVDRDDLPDYGASAFVGVIRQIRRQAQGCKVEVLTPDFRGEEMPLAKVIAERPDVFNHNVEVVPRLYPVARRGSKFERSCRVLRNAKEMGGDEVVTKSGLMVGLGESFQEMVEALGTLRANHVQVLTIGQYLRPTENHLPIVRYWHPDEFAQLERAAYELGFEHVAAGPLVRSSYHADEHVRQAEPGVGPLAEARALTEAPAEAHALASAQGLAEAQRPAKAVAG
jgi:lipoic acid synthetase